MSIKELNDIIEKAHYSPDNVVKELRKIRLNNIDFRRDLHNYLDAISIEKLSATEKFNGFILACMRLLFYEPYTSKTVKIIARRSRLLSLEEDLAQFLEESPENIKELFIKSIETLSSQLEYAWEEVSKCYYELRVKCLK